MEEAGASPDPDVVWLNRLVLALKRQRQEDQDVRVVLSFIMTEEVLSPRRKACFEG